MHCSYCGSDQVSLIIERKLPVHLKAAPKGAFKNNLVMPVDVCLCAACGLGFNATPLDGTGVSYEDYDAISPFEGVGGTRNLALLSYVEKCVPNKNAQIVEIGCASGYLLYSLKNQGYQNTMGFELSEQADEARKRGLNVIRKYYDETSFQGEIIDAFILSHVFEHLPDPFSVFRLMLKNLKENGRIIIEVPKFGGFHHEHLFFYTPHFFSRLAADEKVALVDLSFKKDEGHILAVFEKSSASSVECPESLEKTMNTVRSEEEIFKRKVAEIQEIIKNHETIYWWGTGAWTGTMLHQIGVEKLRDKNVVLIDTHAHREGWYVGGIDSPIVHPSRISGKTADVMVIGASPIFVPEIKKTMEKERITVERMWIDS